MVITFATLLAGTAVGLLHAPPWAIASSRLRDEDCACVLSHAELASLTELKRMAPKAGSEVADPQSLTIDIGRHTPAGALVTAEGIVLSVGRGRGETFLPWKFLEKQAKKRRAGAWECWRSTPDDAEDGEQDPLPARIEGFSELTQRTASLLPLDGAVPPTAVLGGFNMHRVKDISPKDDTERKLGALGPRLRGNVLDICTGLGYTAIGAAACPAVERVYTIELDPLMVELQRANPWSEALFEDYAEVGGGKITRLLGDATDILPALPEAAFDACVHDPPANAMSGELYSCELYTKIRRCLRPGAAFFHYVGDPSSKASGRLFKGIGERLREAGFENVKSSKAAYGISANARGTQSGQQLGLLLSEP